MTRRFGLWIIGSALGLAPLAGCAHWPWKDNSASVAVDPPTQTTKHAQAPSTSIPDEIKQPVAPPQPKVNTDVTHYENRDLIPPPPKTVEIQSVKPLILQPSEALNPAVPHEPLVDALQAVFDNRPHEALQFLAKYDQPTQVILLGSMSYLTLLAKKGIDQLSPSEVDNLNKTLQSLSMSIQPLTKLTIDKAYFCTRIRDFGIFDKLPEGHAFLPGDQVQLYVELRNFVSQPVNEPAKGVSFVTRLSCSFEISDQNGKKLQAAKFDDDEQPIRRQSYLRDYYNNYILYLPRNLRPGTYTLTFRVKDETRPDQPRVADKTLEFRVNAPSGQIQ